MARWLGRTDDSVIREFVMLRLNDFDSITAFGQWVEEIEAELLLRGAGSRAAVALWQANATPERRRDEWITADDCAEAGHPLVHIFRDDKGAPTTGTCACRKYTFELFLAPATEQQPPPQEWDTAGLQRDFEVISFHAPYVVVRRRSDGALGSLMFDHNPRRYYNWTLDVDVNDGPPVEQCSRSRRHDGHTWFAGPPETLHEARCPGVEVGAE